MRPSFRNAQTFSPAISEYLDENSAIGRGSRSKVEHHARDAPAQDHRCSSGPHKADLLSTAQAWIKTAYSSSRTARRCGLERSSGRKRFSRITALRMAPMMASERSAAAREALFR
jgi:hypothetical protein